MKLQHYVPRSYLKHFGFGEEKHPRIWCYDKLEKTAFPTSVKNVAAEKYFYHPPSEPQQPIEHVLGRFETVFGIARQRLLAASDPMSLSFDDKVAVAVFFATQMVRTREHRHMIEDVMKQTREWLQATGKLTPELDEWLGPGDADQMRRQQLQNLSRGLVSELTAAVLRLKWMLLFNATGQPFWTSDHPVALYNPVDAGLYGNLGLACKGIQVFFPLSPSQTLVFCDPVMYADRPPRGEVVPENVIFQNSLEVLASTRYLFGPSSNFAQAEVVLADHPDLADPHRPRSRFGHGTDALMSKARRAREHRAAESAD
ncbi:MAG TPA: DUF4238 domain-containing protein [Vicinamibacterales bacterium]|nr:DUF4238 domain-containing protein [Vicinamibacterales bacterium]